MGMYMVGVLLPVNICSPLSSSMAAAALTNEMALLFVLVIRNYAALPVGGN